MNDDADRELRALLERLAKLHKAGHLSDADYKAVAFSVTELPLAIAQTRRGMDAANTLQQARQLWDHGKEREALRMLDLRRRERGRPGSSPREVVALYADAIEGRAPGYIDARLLERLGTFASPGGAWVGKVWTGEEARRVFLPLHAGEDSGTVMARALGATQTEFLTQEEALSLVERAFGLRAGRGRKAVEEARAKLARSNDPADRDLAERCPPLAYPERSRNAEPRE